MTTEETRIRFESFGPFCDDRNDACDHDCDKCKEMEDRIAEALEKQTQKKPIRTNLSSNAFTVWRRYNCPCCGMFLHSGIGTQSTPQKHCYECGQALDWSEEE